MSEGTTWILAWGAGVGLGAAFFAGLWWTLRRALVAARPALWILGSLLARTSLVLGGIYLVSAGSGVRLALCVLGFTMARYGATRMIRGREPPATSGGTHAT